MKRSTLKLLLSMAAVVGLGTSANADLLFTFDTGANVASTATVPEAGGQFDGGSYAWSAAYQAVQQTSTVGGWTPGGASPKFELSWPSQSIMQTIANNGDGMIEFDMFINNSSVLYWNNTASQYLQVFAVGNSDGANGWTQNQVASVNYDGISDANYSFHGKYTFAQMGWDPSDSWFQVFFGSNTDSANAVELYIDNIHIYETPEPGTFALAGLGAAMLMIFRRR